jgi:TPR repeat protein
MTEAGLRSQEASERRRWFEAAAKAGDAEGMYRFGLLSGDRDWLRKASEKGNAPAMVALGEKEWLEKAAAAGYANAFTKLGQLEKAAQMGDPEAKMLLGDAIRERKPKQAVAYYMEAAKTGFAPAMTRLGDCNRNGQGTSRSEIDALKWYRDAVSAGDATARERLAAMGKSE